MLWKTVVQNSLLLLSICSALFAARTEREKRVHEMFVRDVNMYHVSSRDVSWLKKQVLSPRHLPPTPKEVLQKVTNISQCIQKPTRSWQYKSRFLDVRPLVLPFEETRTLRNIPDFYLGANDVITPEQEYIVTEAPKPPTLERFWNAIMITDVRTIVALALPKNGSIKRPAYWKSPYLPLTTTNGQWTIRCGKEERVAKSAIFPKQVITRRVLSAFRGGVWRNITHLHYENWPDNGPPAADLFYKLLQLVEESQPKEHHKILVHCIAGIGRSGTFVAAHSIMKELNVNPLAPINIPKRIVELRLQRPRLVASESQIQSIYTLVQQLAPQYTTKSGSRHTQHRIHKKHHRR